MKLFVINAQKTVETLFFIPLEKIFGILYYNVVNNKLKNYIFFYGDVVMSKYTIAEIKEMLEKKLSHNFGVTPDQALMIFFIKRLYWYCLIL